MTLTEGGATQFRQPDGAFIPEVPVSPRAPDDPVGSFAEEHDKMGIEVTPWSSTPSWLGEPFDLDWALGALWVPREVAASDPELRDARGHACTVGTQVECSSGSSHSASSQNRSSASRISSSSSGSSSAATEPPVSTEPSSRISRRSSSVMTGTLPSRTFRT